MHIVARARTFVESLHSLTRRRDRDWRHCPACGSQHVYRHGSYMRRPWTLKGRITKPVQPYQCQDCRAAYSETFADLAPGRWYTRGGPGEGGLRGSPRSTPAYGQHSSTALQPYPSCPHTLEPSLATSPLVLLI